jgi:hypothetical protein
MEYASGHLKFVTVITHRTLPSADLIPRATPGLVGMYTRWGMPFAALPPPGSDTILGCYRECSGESAPRWTHARP